MILHPIIDRLKTIAELLPTAIGGEFVPSGTKQISITQNGTTTEDVTQYASAEITVNVPTGVPLPSTISKIDGGSFTPSSDTVTDQQSISHILGVVPKGFVIWTEDEISGTISTRYIANCYIASTNILASNSNNYIAIGAAGMFYNGTAAVLSNNTMFTSTTLPNFMDATRIKWNNSLLFYKAGITYKWIAWS